MSQGWMRVREAASLLSVSESTVRRRIAEGELRGRSGRSGRQEVFVPAKLRQQAEARAKPERTDPTHDDAAASPRAEQPAPHAPEHNDTNEDLLKRYERMAGGSLVLAQKRADELTEAASAAYENLAHARQQLRQVRKVAIAGWATGAGALLLAFVLSLAFGISGARSEARARANAEAADEATEQAESLREQLAEVRDAVADAVAYQASVPTD